MGFLDKLQETLDQGLKSSKELLGKAKEKAKDLGEIGVCIYDRSSSRKKARYWNLQPIIGRHQIGEPHGWKR